MGVKGLFKFIAKVAPSAVREVSLASYNGKTVAIDVSIFMYKHKYSRDHVGGFFKQTVSLLKNGILPVYVFDGKGPQEKRETINKRGEVHLSNLNRKKELEMKLNLPRQMSTLVGAEEVKQMKQELNKLEQRTLVPTSKDFQECKRLFDLFGVPFIQAVSEAEWMCSKLYKEGIVDAILSNDGDTLPNGGGILLAKMNDKTETVMEYNLEKLLGELNLEMPQFIDICIASGCDYTDGIHGVGPAKAYKLIKKHGSLEEIVPERLTAKQLEKLPENFLEHDVARSRTMFSDFHLDQTPESVELDLFPRGQDMFYHFLMNNSRFAPVRAKKMVASITPPKTETESSVEES